MDMREMVVWVLAVLVVGAVLLSPAACTMNRQNKIAEAINGGADPIEAKCAIEAEDRPSPMCILKVARE